MTFKERYQYNPASDLLGKGGFARVYRAYDTNLDIDVAVKFFNATEANAGKYTVYEEIKRAIKLNHPNVLRYFDAAILENTNSVGEREVIQIGIMELANAGDLKGFVRNHPGSPELIRLLKEVLSGLDYLHQRGLIHRDLKPQNILLTDHEGILTVKISDFGISKALDGSGISSSKSIGTIEYMAPEQFNPQKYAVNGEIGTNLDLWSFGVMVYELVAGEPLFGQRGGNTSAEQIMTSILAPELPGSIEKLPEPYRAVVKRCLVHQSADRVQRASELIPLLQVREHSPVLDTLILPKKNTSETETAVLNPKPAPVLETPKAPVKKRRTWLIGLIALPFVLGMYRWLIYEPAVRDDYGFTPANYRFYLVAMGMAILIWGAAYLYTLLVLLQSYTNGLLSERWMDAGATTGKRLGRWALVMAGTPVLSGLVYRLGGMIEEGMGIAWGCYLEYAQLGSVMLWFFGFVLTGLFFLTALSNPRKMGFASRGKLTAAFFLFNVGILVWTIYMSKLINLVAGPLSGKESSCL